MNCLSVVSLTPSNKLINLNLFTNCKLGEFKTSLKIYKKNVLPMLNCNQIRNIFHIINKNRLYFNYLY